MTFIEVGENKEKFAIKRMYNPRSVVFALENDQLADYWTSSGPYDETELSAIVKLVYLSARDDYDMEREDKAGVGYVDYIFYPKRNLTDDCIIVELKVDHAAEEAIQQIKDRNYAQRFIGKLGAQPKYRGRILAVGISYYKKEPGKKHECKIERYKGILL